MCVCMWVWVTYRIEWTRKKVAYRCHFDIKKNTFVFVSFNDDLLSIIEKKTIITLLHGWQIISLAFS